jgi:putative phosphoesterase
VSAIASAKSELRVGVISDTHGLLRAEARAFLTGCDYIIHAGDVGNAAILEELEALAPVIAVRGNNDAEPWAKELRETELIRLGGIFVYIIHELSRLDIDPKSLGVRAVICGHSHKPLIEERAGIIYVNPGSCGPRRFKLPVAIGELLVEGSNVRARIIELETKPQR